MGVVHFGAGCWNFIALSALKTYQWLSRLALHHVSTFRAFSLGQFRLCSTLFDFLGLANLTQQPRLWLLDQCPCPAVPCRALPCPALPCPCPEYLACLFCMDCITLQTSSLKNTAYLDGTTLAFSLPNEKKKSYYMLLLISTNSSKKSSKIKHIYVSIFKSLCTDSVCCHQYHAFEVTL